MKAKEINIEISLLHKLFDYVDGQLVWKEKPSNLKHLIGKVAGCLHRSGYRNIKIKNNIYPAHRLIWIYHHGNCRSDMQIDHINGLKDDNRIENLRLVTNQENCFNRSRLNAKGYTWNKDVKKWQASIWVENKLKYLGLFNEEQDARNAYLNACSINHKIGLKT